MNKKAFIFDLDGVIVYTDQLHYKAWKQVADELGIYFDKEINNLLRGVSRLESLEIILKNTVKEYTQQEKMDIAKQKNEGYRLLLETLSPKDVSPVVRETLLKLKENGYLLAIGSSSKNAKFILEKIELLELFDAISDGTNIVHSKPDPEVFLMAANYLSLPPNECIVVEDAVAGIDAAIAGGMLAVGINDAAKYEKTQVKIQEFSQLLDL